MTDSESPLSPIMVGVGGGGVGGRGNLVSRSHPVTVTKMLAVEGLGMRLWWALECPSFDLFLY